MNGVIGMTELLLGSSLTAEQHEFATIVHDSGHALLTLINDILDFSKIEAGKMMLEAIPLDLRSMVTSVTQLLLPKAREHAIALRVEVAPDVPSLVQGDPDRVRQVLLNLVGNAIKFIRHGEVSVHVSVETASAAQTLVRCAVHDTGVGLSSGQQQRLFQPFTQADSSMTRRFGGTGLGLAISKRLVEAMGGGIGVTSEEGQGSTFWISVPFAVVLPSSDGEPVVAGTESGEMQVGVLPRVPQSKLLIAEDNPVNQKLVVAQLRKLGYQGVVVANGREALAAVETGQYALVLMDCQMPELDGFAATAAIRQREGNRRRLPIIAMTANAMQGDREACLAAGMDDYVSKPVKIGDLRAVIERWRGRSEALESGEASVPMLVV